MSAGSSETYMGNATSPRSPLFILKVLMNCGSDGQGLFVHQSFSFHKSNPQTSLLHPFCFTLSCLELMASFGRDKRRTFVLTWRHSVCVAVTRGTAVGIRQATYAPSALDTFNTGGVIAEWSPTQWPLCLLCSRCAWVRSSNVVKKSRQGQKPN